MTKDELLDLVNEKDEVVGSVWKSKAHKDPKLTHREVAILIFSHEGKVLLGERSHNKTHEPGAWRITAGHVSKGEDPYEAAKREVSEELGISVEPIFYNKRFSTFENKESRFFWTYYAIIDKETFLKVNKEEVEEIKWVKIEDLKKFSEKHKYSLESASHAITMEIYNHISRLNKFKSN